MDIKRIVSLTDPALDVEAMGAELNAYIATRREDLVKAIPGKRLQWMTMRPITASAWASFVSVGASDSEQRRRAFMVAVASVDNVIERDGVFRAGSTVGTQRYPTPTGEIMVWSDAEVDRLFAPATVEDVGEVARVQAIVPFGCAVHLRPPPSSLAALLARVRLRAEELASTLDLSAPAKATPDAPSSGDGAAPTAATATENLTESTEERPTP